MSTYGSESFYRATIRQSIDSTQTVPFTLKVSKIPTLTTGLLTVSPNTANEEILEYNGVDGTALTITVVKMGISPSTQALLVDGTDYNNVTYKKAHSQNDSIRGDVNHLHIIQDYGTLEANKLDKAAGLRTSFAAASTVELNLTTGVEEVKTVSQVSTPTAGDIVRLQKSDLNYEEISYANMKSDIAAVVSPSIQETNYESTIVAGDMVGQTPDGIYKINATSVNAAALGGTNTYYDHIKISSGKFMLLYLNTTNITAVIATINYTTDTVTYGTPLSVAAPGGTPQAKIALVGTDKVVAVYCNPATTTMTSVILSVSGTTISAGVALNETKTLNSGLMSLCKVRTDAYSYVHNNAAGTNYININSISGTTCSTGTQIASSFQQVGAANCYLSDNYIGYYNLGDSSTLINIIIYKINSGLTTVQTTYSNTIGTKEDLHLSRYSDTEFVFTGVTTERKYIATVPGSGTTIVLTALTNEASANNYTIPLFTNIYGTQISSVIKVYQRDVLIGTITGVGASPASALQREWYDNGRLIYFSGTTLIPTICRISSAFAIGIAFNATGLFTPGKIKSTRSGIIKGYRYYIQADGTLSNGIGTTNTVTMTQFYGRGVLTDTIITEL